MVINEIKKGDGVAFDATGEDLRDDLGLPMWAIDSNGMFVCGSSRQQLFAVDCWMIGFNLPKFDKWLSSLGESISQKELLDRRAKAIDATDADNHTALMRHLEFMLTRWRTIEREMVLLAMADSDAGSQNS